MAHVWVPRVWFGFWFGFWLGLGWFVTCLKNSVPPPPCVSARFHPASPRGMQPRLALLASTALSATYPVSLKLIYAADGAPLSPALITSLRFALMAGGAALVLSESSSPAASEPLSEPAAFWRAAAELGFWACAGAQLNTAGLQQIGVVRGTVLLSTINVFTPYATQASNPRRADPGRTLDWQIPSRSATHVLEPYLGQDALRALRHVRGAAARAGARVGGVRARARQHGARAARRRQRGRAAGAAPLTGR